MTTVWLCIGIAVLAFAFGVAGLYLQKLLPEPRASDRSRDMIAAILGLISLLLALVLGTLVGSAYSFYSTQKSEMETFAARAVQLNLALDRIRAGNRAGAREDERDAGRGPRHGVGRERHTDTASPFGRGAAPAPLGIGRICRLARSEDAGPTAICRERRRRRRCNRADAPARFNAAGEPRLLASGGDRRVVGADPVLRLRRALPPQRDHARPRSASAPSRSAARSSSFWSSASPSPACSASRPAPSTRCWRRSTSSAPWSRSPHAA